MMAAPAFRWSRAGVGEDGRVVPAACSTNAVATREWHVREYFERLYGRALRSLLPNRDLLGIPVRQVKGALPDVEDVGLGGSARAPIRRPRHAPEEE